MTKEICLHARYNQSTNELELTRRPQFIWLNTMNNNLHIECKKDFKHTLTLFGKYFKDGRYKVIGVKA